MLRKLLFAFVATASALQAAPVITSISPTFGPSSGGTSITITGSGFSNVVQVNFGQAFGSPMVINDSTLTVIAPAYFPGAVNVTVFDGTNTSPVVREDIYTFTGTSYDFVTNNTSPGNLTQYSIPANQFVSNTSVNFLPQDVAITGDGLMAIVPGGTDGSVDFVDLLTNSIPHSYVIKGGFTKNVAISPDNLRGYVTETTSNSILIYDLATFQSLPSILVGQPVGELAISADNTKLYVASTASDQVLVYDIATSTLLTTITGILQPKAMTLSTDGQTLYVTSLATNAVYRINVPTNILNPIPILVGASPISLAATSDGQSVYVVDNVSQDMYIINTTTNTATLTPATFSSAPLKISLTQDNSAAYVVTNVGFDAVNLTNFTSQSVPLVIPMAEAIEPDQAPVASFTSQVNGATATFDASNSISPVGSVVSYAWTFGDGASLMTSTPNASHTYSSSGTFPVTLTVTNSQGTSTNILYIGQMVSHNGGDFATVSKSVTVTAQPTPPSKLLQPQVFLGQVLKHQGKLVLATTWQKVPNAAFYQIFGHDKLIAQIPATQVNFFSLKLHPKKYYHHHIHKLEKRLEKQYKIRAVDAQGGTSAFTSLSFE